MYYSDKPIPLNKMLQENPSLEHLFNISIEGKDYKVFKESFTVEEYLKLIKNSSRVLAFERLEELTDEAKEQDQKYKQWRKKYNNGLPTSVPYVIKDATYDKITKEKKHLYNKKYKIKKHKKLTAEEKQKRLDEIDERLAILSAQIKYLTREESIELYKQNNGKQ